MIAEAELDKFIYTIVKDCPAVSPPLSRGEIEDIAVDQMELQLKQKLDASLARLVQQGLLSGESSTGSPKRYGLTRETAV